MIDVYDNQIYAIEPTIYKTKLRIDFKLCVSQEIPLGKEKKTSPKIQMEQFCMVKQTVDITISRVMISFHSKNK